MWNRNVNQSDILVQTKLNIIRQSKVTSNHQQLNTGSLVIFVTSCKGGYHLALCQPPPNLQPSNTY